MLVLVRHAMPAFGPDTPAHEWVLSEEGRLAATELAQRLPADARLVSSDEPKAYQTLEPLGVATRDERFNEIWRHGEPWDGDFRELRRAYVDGIDHAGWEPRAEVAERFDHGIRAQLESAGDGPLVVASHGMAMTLWLTRRIGLPDPGAFWAGLQFPDAHVVNLEAGTVARLRP